MHKVHRFSTDRRLQELDGLADGPVSADNGDHMSDQKTSQQAKAAAKDESGPLLRLAGTLAGEPTDAEKRVLELRSRAVLVLGSLRRDSRMLSERLERAGRFDPVKIVTGASALDVAANGTEELIQNLDELLLEVGDSVPVETH